METILVVHFLQLFRGDTEVLPGQPGDIVPPSQWDAPRTPSQEGIRNRCPSHLDWPLSIYLDKSVNLQIITCPFPHTVVTVPLLLCICPTCVSKPVLKFPLILVQDQESPQDVSCSHYTPVL